MEAHRKTGIQVGALFIVTTLTYSIGDGILQEIFTKTSFLIEVSTASSKFVAAIVLQLLCGFGVVGIAVLMYPLFKPYNEKLALLYIGNRLMECTIIAVSGISLLSLLSLGKNAAMSADVSTTNYPILGTSFLAEYHAAFLILSLVLSFGAFVFYSLLFLSKLVPRFLSVWGIVAVILMIIGLLLDALGYGAQIILYIPMGLNELFLGIWLIFKGFNLTAIQKVIYEARE